MPGASLALFADLGVCHVQKSSVTICVLPTPSRWRATPHLVLAREFVSYFYPRPPGGGRPHDSGRFPRHDRDFYPRPPGGGRLLDTYERPAYPEISIHALRVEGDIAPKTLPTNLTTISIHALRVEGDDAVHRPRDPVDTISIHALRVEGDIMRCSVNLPLFYFYPRPPGGGRRCICPSC